MVLIVPTWFCFAKIRGIQLSYNFTGSTVQRPRSTTTENYILSFKPTTSTTCMCLITTFLSTLTKEFMSSGTLTKIVSRKFYKPKAKSNFKGYKLSPLSKSRISGTYIRLKQASSKSIDSKKLKHYSRSHQSHPYQRALQSLCMEAVKIWLRKKYRKVKYRLADCQRGFYWTSVSKSMLEGKTLVL
jgi:hypothetical protein